MIRANKEFYHGIFLLSGLGLVFTGITCFWMPSGTLAVLISWLAAIAAYYLTQRRRYLRLQKMARDLEGLLQHGKKLPLEEYQEGELSILACQIQKIALHLAEAAQTVQADKLLLADSLADISHQLRTPLTAMNLTASMLSQRELSHDRRLALTHELRELLGRTQWLVEALLKLSKLDAGTVTMTKEPVCVAALIRRAAEPLSIPMELRSQRLVVRCEGEQFVGDLVWSGEALGNILKNAMEHTPQDGTITVTAQETPLYTQITVEDTGEGFALEDIPHLFDRFYKGKNASGSSYGIGLALARRVIVAQGGTVQAVRSPTGAKFVIKYYKQTV